MNKIKQFFSELDRQRKDCNPIIYFLQMAMVILFVFMLLIKIFVAWSWLVICSPLYVLLVLEIIECVIDYVECKESILCEKHLIGKRIYFICCNEEQRKVTGFYQQFYEICYGMNCAFFYIDNEMDCIHVNIFRGERLRHYYTTKAMLPCLCDLRMINVESHMQMYCDSIDNYLMERGLNYLADELGIYKPTQKEFAEQLSLFPLDEFNKKRGCE